MDERTDKPMKHPANTGTSPSGQAGFRPPVPTNYRTPGMRRYTTGTLGPTTSEMLHILSAVSKLGA
jgi:hypothetical protein